MIRMSLNQSNYDLNRKSIQQEWNLNILHTKYQHAFFVY